MSAHQLQCALLQASDAAGRLQHGQSYRDTRHDRPHTADSGTVWRQPYGVTGGSERDSGWTECEQWMNERRRGATGLHRAGGCSPRRRWLMRSKEACRLSATADWNVRVETGRLSCTPDCCSAVSSDTPPTHTELPGLTRSYFQLVTRPLPLAHSLTAAVSHLIFTLLASTNCDGMPLHCTTPSRAHDVLRSVPTSVRNRVMLYRI